MTTIRSGAVLAVLSAFACGVDSQVAVDDPSRAEANGAITNGTPTSADPAVVFVGSVRQNYPAGAVAGCSGVLVAPRVVMSAAHCFSADKDGPVTKVVVAVGTNVRAGQVSQMRTAVRWVNHPSYRPAVGGQFGISDHGASDIAVVVIDRPFEGVSPIEIDRDPNLGFGESVRIVGFGQTSGAANDGYVKRTGTGMIIQSEANYVRLAGPSTQCFGDSGGPSLRNRGGVERVIGLSSHVSYGGQCFDNWNTRVGVNLDFVDAQMAANR